MSIDDEVEIVSEPPPTEPAPVITAAKRCLGPHHMDAEGGPVCSCGRASTHESGWCGTLPPEDEHCVDCYRQPSPLYMCPWDEKYRCITDYSAGLEEEESPDDLTFRGSS